MDEVVQVEDSQASGDASPRGPVVLAPGADALSQVKKTDAERKLLLSGALDDQLAAGARIESQSDYQAVVVRGRRPRHLVHAIATAATLGLWTPVWILITVAGGEKRTTIDVDRFGNVFVRQI